MFRLRGGMKGKILCTDKVIEMVPDVGRLQRQGG